MPRLRNTVAPEERRCLLPDCQKPLPPPKRHGPPRKFCCDGHRVAYYNIKHPRYDLEKRKFVDEE